MELTQLKHLFLGLSQLPNVGRKSVTSLLQAANYSYNAFQSMEQGDIELILKNKRIPTYGPSAEIIAKAKSNGLMPKGEKLFEDYQKKSIQLLLKHELPQSLQSISSAPEFLFVCGDPSVLFDGFFVGVVGTRKPSEGGIKSVSHLYSVLDKARYLNIKIVSGLAEGIDAEAHRVGVKHGFKNIAFLGCGLNHVFPKSTAYLRDKMVDQGGVVASEYLPNEIYQKQKFVERNRLQAALSDLMVIVQAEYKSGTAHTVRFANQFEKQMVGLDFGEMNPILDLVHKTGPIIPIKTTDGKKELFELIKFLASEENQLSFEHILSK